jgi:uncharacterized protein (DUF58 family)/transglutaminase-like putative cysteine protease
VICGLSAIVYARLFGAAELALLGASLVAAVAIARAWVGFAGGAHAVVRSLPPFARAGERVRVAVELRPLDGARPGRASFREAGSSQVCALRPVTVAGLRVLRGSYELGPLRRGLHELQAGQLVREDAFGLARRIDATRGSTTLTVIAAPLELPDGAPAGGGDALLARGRLRGGGHELHGVREHEPGESLRGVHWPATAHRGRLMVKELDDAAGDELAVVLDARASCAVGTPPDTSFELAVAAAGALVERAQADARRVRLVLAGGDGEPASATERTAVRRLLARAQAGGERSPRELVSRLAAAHVAVVTSRPAAFVGAGRARRLDVVAIDPSGFDSSLARDAAALAALRAAGSRVVELRRHARDRPAPVAVRAPRSTLARWALFALAALDGLLHVRELQVPALSAASLLPLVALAATPALVAVRAGRRLGLVVLAAALLVAAWIAAGHPPTPASPLGGLGEALLDAPSAWVQVVLPFDRSHPELRAAVLIAAFLWLAALAQLWLVRPRPLVAGLLAMLPFAVSATVYDLPERPWRGLVAAALLLAFLRSGRPAGGGAAVAAGCAALALLIGAGWSAVPAASRPAVLPWTTWTFSRPVPDAAAVGLVWDMGYQPLSYPSRPVEVLRVRAPHPSYWRALVLGAFDGLRFRRTPQLPAGIRERDGTVGVPGAPTGTPMLARVDVAALVTPFLVAPGQPVGYTLPVSAGTIDVAPDGSAELQAPPAEGLAYAAAGVDRNPSARALRSLPADYPPEVTGNLAFAGVLLPPFAVEGREQQLARLFRARRGDPAWRAWRMAYAKARAVTRGAASPYQAIVALEAWLRTTRAYDDQARLPATADALARWSSRGTAGYCQMFAASLAALARLSGVPARVAEGFAPGTLRDGAYHVTDRDAHAWVEAWFPGFGWLPFDATPGRALPERASSSSPAFDGAAAAARLPQVSPGGSAPRLRLPLRQLRAHPGGTNFGARAGVAWWRGPRAAALALLGFLAVAALLVQRALARRARPADPACAARWRISSYAADQGIELAPALTPRELGAALERHFGVDGGAFAGALERAAYGRPGARDDRALEHETALVLRALRAALGRPRRLRGALSLRAWRGPR